MTRSFLSLATIFALALTAGCAKKNEETQTPDAVSGDAGAEGDAANGDAAASSSRARGSTATRGAGGKVKARKVTAKKPPRAKPPEVDPSDDGPNGLFVEAFAMPANQKLPEDLASLGGVTESFTIPNLDVDEADFTNGFPGAKALKENYALRFSGSINILEEAEYELCLHSDDGSQLLLEGMMVVDNNGIHDAPVEACELVYLAAGEYMLEIRYVQASGPLLALHMAWAINGGDKVIVPSEVLFKPSTGG